MATALPNPLAVVKEASRWGVLWGVLLVLFGMLAIGEPFIAALALATFIAWLLVLVGAVHAVLAFHAHSGSRTGWKLLVALAYVFIGSCLLIQPVLGIAALTLLLGFLFFVEGVLDVMLWWKARAVDGAFWILVDGVITLVLGGMIYEHWPSSSVWAIGTLVGISLIISGVTRVMLSLAAGKVGEKLATG